MRTFQRRISWSQRPRETEGAESVTSISFLLTGKRLVSFPTFGSSFAHRPHLTLCTGKRTGAGVLSNSCKYTLLSSRRCACLTRIRLCDSDTEFEQGPSVHCQNGPQGVCASTNQAVSRKIPASRNAGIACRLVHSLHLNVGLRVSAGPYGSPFSLVHINSCLPV